MYQEFSEARTKMMVGGVQSVMWVSEEESLFKIVEEVKQMLSGALPAPPQPQPQPEPEHRSFRLGGEDDDDEMET
jgi:hypothetical protein